MILLICGGRDWVTTTERRTLITSTLLSLLPNARTHVIAMVGPDNRHDSVCAVAARYLGGMGVHVAVVDDLWTVYGKHEVSARNKAMLLLKPDLVIAFPGGRGTASMVSLAKAAGVKTMEVTE